MAFLFGKKPLRPSELVRHAYECALALDKAQGKTVEKVSEEITKYLASMKLVLYGDGEHEPNPDDIVQLANEVYQLPILLVLIENITKLEFEARKDLTQIFNNLLRRQIGSRSPTVDYIEKNPDILRSLIKGYESPEVAVNCGNMLRDAIRHEVLAKEILYSEDFWKFFSFVENANFDVAADAFSTFKELVTKHKALCAEFLERNYDKFFEHYNALLHSQNYVTRRQSLKLLGELLLDRSNFNVMTKFISESTNLKAMMNMLRDKSRSIQFEAFHVFKVFVANPNKAKPIADILLKNKEKLVQFLSNFHNDKEDEQFTEEKAFLLKQIQAMAPQ